jgi:hypothetical protein
MSAAPANPATYYPNLSDQPQSVQDAIKRAYDNIYALRAGQAAIVQANNVNAAAAKSAVSLSQKTQQQVTSLPSFDLLQSGSSTQLKATQASVLPAHNTPFSWTATPTSITFTWTNMQIAWPDGTTTTISGTLTVTGLTPGTTYYFYAGYNVRLNVVQFSPQGAPANCPNGVGTPPIAYLAPNIFAASAADGDGMQNLASGLMAIPTPSTGTSSGTVGGK